MSDFMKEYYQHLEQSIMKLSKEQQATVYTDCAYFCAMNGVLQAQASIFEKYHGDLDDFYTHMDELGDVSGKVINSGSDYEIQFPHCLCPLYHEGYVTAPTHCECSRQNILAILHHLLPNRTVTVTPEETVLSGGTCCRFRVHFN